MTTETLKPFIPQQSVDNFPAAHASATSRQRSLQFLVIGLSVTVIVMTLTLLGFTFWNLKRVSSLEAEVKSLDKVIANMQKRLGINYLEDLTDFEKEYNNALLDHPDTLHDDDDDDDDEDVDDEDEEFDYDEFRRKYLYDDLDEDNDEDVDEDEEDMSISDNDNVYSDFEKYKDLKKKQEKSRVTRAITAEHSNKQQQILKNTNTETTTPSTATPTHHQMFKKKMLTMRLPVMHAISPENAKDVKPFVSESVDHKRPHRRHRDYRKAIVKSGKTARQLSSMPFTPAAHFHLNRKVSDAYAPINVHSYSGDMYIGHPSWSNEMDIDSYFKVNNGMLTVLEPGLYYVYAQVCYNNTHDQNGFVIFHGHKPFLQCLNTVPTNMPHKIHTCHTSGLIYLKEDETIHLRDFHSDRNVILKDLNNRSYFGLIKI